jgi:hypothetical protein
VTAAGDGWITVVLHLLYSNFFSFTEALSQSYARIMVVHPHCVTGGLCVLLVSTYIIDYGTYLSHTVLRLTHTRRVTILSHTVTRVYWLLVSLKAEYLLLGLRSQLLHLPRNCF